MWISVHLWCTVLTTEEAKMHNRVVAASKHTVFLSGGRAVKIASKSGCPQDNHFSKYSCPHRIFGCHTKKECWLPGTNIIKCLFYFVVPMNAAVHVMCFYYSS